MARQPPVLPSTLLEELNQHIAGLVRENAALLQEQIKLEQLGAVPELPKPGAKPSQIASLAL